MNPEAGNAALIVAVVALTTAGIRAAPFVLFPPGKKTPEPILSLGRVLPSAVIGMLVVYCLKDVSPLRYPYGLPELIALLAVAGLHLWKKNALLSIGAGTALYMLLVQLIF